MGQYDKRRNEILDTAFALFMQNTYEKTSIQQILDALGIAKGTFYHYFDSKIDLLDGYVTRMSEGIMAQLEEVLGKPGLNAVERLNLLFRQAGLIKTEQQNLEALKAILLAYYDDNNLKMRMKMTREIVARSVPFVEDIIRQGVDEGVFKADDPHHMAEILMNLMVASSDDFGRHITGGGMAYALDRIRETWAYYETAMARILGASEGSIKLMSDDVFRRFKEGFEEPGASPDHHESMKQDTRR